MVDYFIKNDLDCEFYDRYIKDRLPKKIADAHLHLSLPEHNAGIPEETIRADWALQCYSAMSLEDYSNYAKAFYPDAEEVCVNALPSVFNGTDLKAANQYLIDISKDKRVFATHMVTHPDWDAEYCEELLLRGNYNGFKPYPDLASGQKGAEIGIFEYLTHDQLKILDRHKKSLVLHIPRAGRLADDNNVRELLEMRQKYPDVKIVLAHCGRCYCLGTIERAKQKMGSDFKLFYYDLAAVLNPEVIEYMITNVSPDSLIYGTDLPIFLWHGRRKWEGEKYYNFARENFDWNRHTEGAEREKTYTFFLYEQLKNILDVTDRMGGRPIAEKIFHDNALRIMQ